MATDRTEATRRGIKPKKRISSHPFVMLEHRILDSEAFADMRPSSQILLVLMNRQFNGFNNGHISASFGWVKRYGFGSDNTLKSAIAELREHGFIFKTRSHGANGQWAKYALTWLPLSKERDGLFLSAYEANLWRNWQPNDKKSSDQKLRSISRKNCDFNQECPAETAETKPSKTATYVDIPSMPVSSAEDSLKSRPPPSPLFIALYPSQDHRRPWISANSEERS